MRKLFVLVLVICFSFNAIAEDEEFIELIKKTASIYSGVMNIDENMPGEVSFETILDNQKIFLFLSSHKLEATVLTVLNNDPVILKNKKSFPVPNVFAIELLIKLNESATPTSSCDGSDVIPYAETSCAGKKCTIIQRIVSYCNETNCWDDGPAIDRTFQGLYGTFNLAGKVDITDCIPSSIAGSKYKLKVEATDSQEMSGSIGGGTIQYSIILQNDSVSAPKRSR